MNQGEQLTDVYKLPPMEFQPYDEWKKDSNGEDEEFPCPEPEPDYSNSDEDQEDVDSTYNAAVWQARKENLQDGLQVLSREDYDKILASAERNLTNVDIPEPDYLTPDEDGDHPNGNSPLGSPPGSPGYTARIFTVPELEDGSLIEPKKLQNPCVGSRERQDLHRELLLNQKLGVDVLHKKSELKKELQRRQEIQKKKEIEEYHRTKRSSFEIKLEEQANKLKLADKTEDKTKKVTKTIPEDKEQPEFLKVHSKINRSKSDS